MRPSICRKPSGNAFFLSANERSTDPARYEPEMRDLSMNPTDPRKTSQRPGSRTSPHFMGSFLLRHSGAAAMPLFWERRRGALLVPMMNVSSGGWQVDTNVERQLRRVKSPRRGGGIPPNEETPLRSNR
jgi:hypothetical protein